MVLVNNTRRPPLLQLTQKSDRLTICLAGKIGEIVQGWHPEYRAFFVSAAVTSGPNENRAYVYPARQFEVVSRYGNPVAKARRAAGEYARLIGVDHENLFGRIELDTGTPVGKGLGSSSIDTGLAILGLAAANDLPAHPRELYQAQCRVERSDPVYLPEELVVAEPEAGLYHVLGPQHRALIVGWDTAPEPTAVVDTQEAAGLDAQRRNHAREYADLLEMVSTGDPILVRQAATRSSVLNNQWLPKSGFSASLRLANDVGAGLLSAHTGTYLALILDPSADAALIGTVRARIREMGFKPELFMMGAK